MTRGFAIALGVILLPCFAMAQSVSAVLEPIQQVEIKSAVAGRLDKVQVQEGETVVAGALLAKIDAKVQEARLRLARTASEAIGPMDRADIVIAQAQSMIDRIEKARKKGAAQAWEMTQSTQALELAQADRKIAAESVEQLKEQYELEKATLAEFSMKAPFDGTVLQVFVEQGEIIDTQKTVLELGNLDRLKATVFVPLDWLGMLNIGDSVSAQVQPGGDQVDATVVSIDPRVDPASQSVRMRLELDNPDHRFFAGTSIIIDRP